MSAGTLQSLRRAGVDTRSVGPTGRALLRPFLALALVLAYAWLLHHLYSTQISPFFSYLGYRYKAPTPGYTVLSLVVVWLVAMLLPASMRRPSALILWVLFVLTVAPSLLMAGYTSYLGPDRAVTTCLVLGFSYAVAVLLTRPSTAARLDVSLPPWLFRAILLLVCALTYGILAVEGALSVSPVGLDSVYDLREDYSAVVGSNALLGYLVFNQANVVNPLIFARGIRSGRWHLAAAGLLGQWTLYASTGFKTVIFSTLVLVIVMVIYLRRNPLGILVLFGACAVMLLAWGVDAATDNQASLTSLFGRRFLMTPGVFTSVYVAFFSENPLAFLGHSVLSPFFDYPYETSIPYVIGDWMAGLPSMAANANLFADGFANFGWGGVVGVAVFLALYARTVDAVSTHLPGWVAALVMVMPTIALSNTSLFTAVLSHGLGLALVLLLTAPATGWQRSGPSSSRRRTRPAASSKPVRGRPGVRLPRGADR
ncbi:hypothetical protein ABZ787_07420 [Micrococcus luteus]|uniref:hypothetical protein n=1 Tax=Micrococcus TaxID=1269 RepID=UPI0019D2A1C0|nr:MULTISPECIES: hypothetical protein [Micrococcus]MCV7522696.1 hypothetical protein [Micrococcus luteus]MCV7696606.1 hypothetical protein [Micrococcus luteus]